MLASHQRKQVSDERKNSFPLPVLSDTPWKANKERHILVHSILL